MGRSPHELENQEQADAVNGNELGGCDESHAEKKKNIDECGPVAQQTVDAVGAQGSQNHLITLALPARE